MNGSKKIRVLLFLSLILVSEIAFGADWQRIVDKNKNSLITIRYYSPYRLNNESIATFFATGTIVDKDRGLVLVDRETVQTSPSVLVGYLQNYERIELKSIYYDPIHNYAFLKFDPKKVRWSDIGEVKLGDSDTLKMGDEIMLLATKKNQNLGVVRGNIVDIRRPKRINNFKYEDYNTVYYDTSLVSIDEGGGVILDRNGSVVALHSWVHEANAYDYSKDKGLYAELPINVVRDVLRSIQDERPIKRGDLGLVLDFMTFTDAMNFGVPNETLDRIKSIRNSRGLLYVSVVVKGTANDEFFKTGDIITSIGGQTIADDFLRYETILNGSVGRKVPVMVFRNGKGKEVTGYVFDLLKTKIDRFVLFSGGIFQNIPWFIKVKAGIGNEGVYVSSYYPGSPLACSNFFENNVITSVNGIPVKDIDEFYKTVVDLPNDQLVLLRYTDLVLNNKEEIRTFRINNKLFETRRFKKGVEDGDWNEY